MQKPKDQPKDQPKDLSLEEAASKTRAGGNEDFFYNVRRKVIPRLVEAGLLAGKTVRGTLRVRDDDNFRRRMGYGIEEFAGDLQGWSFVAVRAPVERVAEALRDKPGVLRHTPGVRPGRMKKGAGIAAAYDRRHAFLVKTRRSDWPLLVLTAHWFQNSDALLATRLAADLSAALRTRAVAAWDDDFSGPVALVCDEGRKSAVVGDETDANGFHFFFYEQGIAAPACFISTLDDAIAATGPAEGKRTKKGGAAEPRLLVEGPSQVERADYLLLEVPEAFRSNVPHVFEKLGLMAAAVAAGEEGGEEEEGPEDEEAFRSQMVEAIWKQVQAASGSEGSRAKGRPRRG